MSGQVTITQLPLAGALTGSESVPIVQNGVTVQTTTGAISGAGALNYPFLTIGSTAGLSQARYITVGAGLTTVDGGVGTTFAINMTGAAASLNALGNGLVAKTGTNTVVNRQITVGGGMTISNGDGIAGNPAIGLNANLQALSSLSGIGLMTVNGSTFGQATLLGDTNTIAITNGNAQSGFPVIAIASNPILPGNAGVVLPTGTTAQRGTGINGELRYNTDTSTLEAYANNVWGAIVSGSGVATFSAGTTGFNPAIPTSGGVILSGVLNSSSGGTGAGGTLTGYVYANGTSAMTASTTIPTTALSGTISNGQLAYDFITINGNSVVLGSSTTVTASTTAALTIGTGLSGTSFNGSTPVTIAIDSTVATLTGSQTLTNKTISGASNIITNIGNSSLVNSSITINGNAVSLGGSTTVTADTPNALTIGTGLLGTSFNGSAPVTIAIANSGVTAGTYGSSSVVPVITVNAQGQITSISTQASNAPAFQGVWNANTNSPTLTSSVGTAGNYYVVNVAGNTTLNGVSGWNVGDWAIFQNGVWDKIPGSTTESFTNLITTNLQIGGITGFVYANNTTGYVTAATTAQLLSLLGTLPVSNGGTGVATLTGLAYGNGTSAFTAATAAQVVSVIGTTAVTNATNATNTAVTLNTTDTADYITFVNATSGNLGQLVNSSITVNPSKGTLTGGIAGGAF
jgi:hypothetical protein